MYRQRGKYHADLYRKYYLHAYTLRHLWKYILRRCRCDYRDDDFEAILWGFLDGLHDGYDPQVPGDVRRHA